MLYLIGLGLGDAKDITVKGLEVVRRCSRVYLEAYTSVLTVGKEALEEFYGRELIVADREDVEQGADRILKDADSSDVAFLVVGDPFGISSSSQWLCQNLHVFRGVLCLTQTSSSMASRFLQSPERVISVCHGVWSRMKPVSQSCPRATTHSDLVLRATKLGIPHRVIHNASIMNAVGCCGLQLYRFGETVSIVFWTDTWRPESFFDKVKKNRQSGMHTLCLLDIKVKEQSLENLIKGRKIYEPPRYMTVSQAAQQLLEIVENQRARGEEPAVTEDTLCVGLARVGAEDQRIAAGTLQQMCAVDLGGPLHSLIITGGSLHPLETEMLSLFPVPEASPASQGTDGPRTQAL